MPPEPQSVIKIAGSDGRIAEARIENIEGEIRSGNNKNFSFHACGMAVARPYGFEMHILRNLFSE